MTMKMTKRDLKLMMKECLVELIQEGAFNIVAIQQPTIQQQPQMPMQQMPQPSRQLMQLGMQPMVSEADMLARQAAAHYAQAMAGNNNAQAGVFQAIFEDTIKNTMPKQAMSTDKFQGQQTIAEAFGANEVQTEVKNLNQVGDVNRWAKIAFASGKKRLPGQPLGPDEDDLG